MEKQNVSIILVASFVVLAAASSIVIDSETTVSIQNISIDPGDQTTMPIIIKDAKNVYAIHINLSYDASVIHVNDIGNSEFNFETFRDINNMTGYMSYAVFNNVALSGDLRFADIKLKAVGFSGDETPLNFDVVTVIDGKNITPLEVVNGTLTIE
ncbi:MAG: cohesin domain-containing protein [Halobacteriota archaeon]|nr:cohesin domain-containing protein [Halobacteriota archaeon]